MRLGLGPLPRQAHSNKTVVVSYSGGELRIHDSSWEPMKPCGSDHHVVHAECLPTGGRRPYSSSSGQRRDRENARTRRPERRHPADAHAR